MEYLDNNATTPIEPRVLAELLEFTEAEFGNAGSRTHEFGARAKRRTNLAREQVAAVVGADPTEVIFTSGATESNNLAIQGLMGYGVREGKKHIVSTQIEHKSVLEPLARLSAAGFEIELVPPRSSGAVDAERVAAAVRGDTLLVSTMQVNNETGIVQPIEELVELIGSNDPLIHVDAAQGFGKQLDGLIHPRIDLISVSAHKLFGPKGVGALIVRQRGAEPARIEPLIVGGGQERGLRSGTLPVGHIAAFGLACELAVSEAQARAEACESILNQALGFVDEAGGSINGDRGMLLGNAVNFSIPGMDAETFLLATKSLVAVSNGSACTSSSYEPSHVLMAMQLDQHTIDGAVRMSWSHLTGAVDWHGLIEATRPFIQRGALQEQ